jgi:uncharacterized membrane protein YphA (DoxX/SURF4 family)
MSAPTALRNPHIGMESAPAAGWQRAVGILGAVALGAVLLFAAGAKALDPAAFAESIAVQGLDFLLPATAMALAVLAFEAGLGTALVLAVRRLWVLVPAALLVVGFLAITGREWYLVSHGLRDPAESCGCFGNLVDRTPAEAFWQDLVMLGLPLALAFVGRRGESGRRFPKVRTALAVAAAAAVAGFAWKAPELPLDDLATRLAPGVSIDALCAGEGSQRVCLPTVVPELEEGHHLVVIADLDSPALTDSIDRLNDYAFAARDGEAPPLWVLTSAESERVRTFFWSWGPVFEIREAPAALLRPLYRRLPRSFLVDGGRVAATYSGLPPLEEPPHPTSTTP